MALSYKEYEGDSSNKNFGTPPYLNKSHIHVYVAGVEVSYTWLTSATVQLATAPVAGSRVVVKRLTDISTKMGVFTNASMLSEGTLSAMQTQLLYSVQEASDASNGIAFNSILNTVDAGGRRITHVADPVDAQDVATKEWVETLPGTDISLAVSAAQNAATMASNANLSALAAAHKAIDAQGTLASVRQEKTNIESDVLASLKIGQEDGLATLTQKKQVTPSQLSNVPNDNYIINGNFDIWQRALTQTTNGYGSDDRWSNSNNGSTKTHSRQVFALGETDSFDSPAKYFSRTVVTSVVGASNFCVKGQRIEGVSTLSGKKATLSFWAKADTPKNIAIDFYQNFGTGGTPSTTITGIGSQLIAITTTWAKHVVTVDIPSILGKTLGTADTDHLQLNFWFDAGTSYATTTSNIGQQSGTFDIAQIKLEAGSVCTPFVSRTPEVELAACQRFFETGHCYIYALATSNAFVSSPYSYLVQKRKAATLSYTNSSASNLVDAALIVSSVNGFAVNIQCNGVGSAWDFYYIADAEL
jgi:hypothetical protein